MQPEKLLTISEFARLSGITRTNLIFYDECGILPPEKVGRNGYRYYGTQQFEAAYLLRTLKEFGMSLKEIRSFAREKTVEGVKDIFIGQKERMTRQIELLRHKVHTMQVYIDTMQQAVDDRREGGVLVKDLPAEPLVLGPVIRDLDSENVKRHFVDFYNDVAARGLSFGFPLGCMVEKRDLLKGRGGEGRRMFFRAPESRTMKKRGLYVVGYAQGDYFGSDSVLYPELHRYIEDNGYEICGNAYEDYILDCMLVTNPNDYLMRLSIHVRKK